MCAVRWLPFSQGARSLGWLQGDLAVQGQGHFQSWMERGKLLAIPTSTTLLANIEMHLVMAHVSTVAAARRHGDAPWADCRALLPEGCGNQALILGRRSQAGEMC